MLSLKEEKIRTFDVDGLLTEASGIFGLPFTADESDIIIIPVPWDVTVSYKEGTSKAPEAILKASKQIEIYDNDYPDAWYAGFFMEQASEELKSKNKTYRERASTCIAEMDKGVTTDTDSNLKDTLAEINVACLNLHNTIEQQAGTLLDSGKLVAILGGEHSAPIGLLRALAQRHDSFSILHFDAHADLRPGYEGFDYSHASVIHHALKLKSVSGLVQVGIRDYGYEEADLIKNTKHIHSFTDNNIRQRIFEGTAFKEVATDIINALGQKVYISFDIDGLDPSLCPGTGTPVPGGLQFSEVAYILKMLSQSGKKIIGFDLCEVAPGIGEWDASVGARILYKLCSATAFTQKK